MKFAKIKTSNITRSTVCDVSHICTSTVTLNLEAQDSLCMGQVWWNVTNVVFKVLQKVFIWLECEVLPIVLMYSVQMVQVAVGPTVHHIIA